MARPKKHRAMYCNSGAWIFPESGVLPSGEIPCTRPQEVISLGGLQVEFWRHRSVNMCAANGIVWDGQNVAVLAHEVGHFVTLGGGECAAWEAAAILFGKNLVLENWHEVEKGLVSYGYDARLINILRQRISCMT